jgi:hypothetical protein
MPDNHLGYAKWKQCEHRTAQLRGECGTMSAPLGEVIIDATGSLGQESGTFSDSCGVYSYTASGGFFGRDLRMSLVATSRTCWNMNMTINLSR